MEFDNLAVAIRDALSVLSILPNMPADKPTLAKAWLLVAKSNNLTAEDVKRGTGRLLESCKFFPTPSEMLEASKPPYPTGRVWTPPPALPAPPRTPESIAAILKLGERVRSKFQLLDRADDPKDLARKRAVLEAVKREHGL